jgi:hypothetical protein
MPVEFPSVTNPRPSPIRILNTGPAKHAVMSMFASPVRAMMIFEDQSASTLKPVSTIRTDKAVRDERKCEQYFKRL